MAKKKPWLKKAGETGYKLTVQLKNPVGKLKTDHYHFAFRSDAVRQRGVLESANIIKKNKSKITPVKLKQARVRIFPAKKRKRKK